MDKNYEITAQKEHAHLPKAFGEVSLEMPLAFKRTEIFHTFQQGSIISENYSQNCRIHY